MKSLFSHPNVIGHDDQSTEFFNNNVMMISPIG